MVTAISPFVIPTGKILPQSLPSSENKLDFFNQIFDFLLLSLFRVGSSVDNLAKRNYLAPLLLIGALYGPILYRMQNRASDYQVHAKIAAQMSAGHDLLTPHFLYQLLLIFIDKITNFGFAFAGMLTVLACAMLTAVILYDKVSAIDHRQALGLSVALLLVSPVLFLATVDDHLYFGYLGINVFHNPTILLLKPLALASFFYAADLCRNRTFSKTCLVTSTLITILAVMAKPSFTICIIPSLLLFTLIKLIRKRPFDRHMLVAGFILPALVILIFQYFITYSSAQIGGVYAGASSVIFAPFAVMSTFSTHLLIKFICSVLFPLGVLICYFRSALRNQELRIAWVCFFFGAAYSYLLAESGPRMIQGNFLWSAQITLFILFVASLLLVLRHLREARSKGATIDRRIMVCSLLFALHLLSGIIFYSYEFYDTELFW